jgi:hypothetical protein
MDSVHFRIPRGAHTPEQTFKACVLGVWQDSVVWPLLWMLMLTDVAEITVPPLPLPERELAVYAGPYFTLLLPSELVTIILEHVDAWPAHREQLLMALRLTEGNI